MSPQTSDTLALSWGGLQGLPPESAGRRERRHGREKGKKWTAAKQLSLPPCRSVQSRRQSNSAWCLSSFSRLVPAWDSGKGLSDCPLCLTSQRGPSQPRFPKERDLGWWRLFFSEKKTCPECSGSSFITLSCPSSANDPSGAGARKWPRWLPGSALVSQHNESIGIPSLLW